jgi:hypothetical protein
MSTNNINSGKFRLNLTSDEISLKYAIEKTLGEIYQDEIDKAFYENDKILLHKLIALAKEHIYG